MVPKRLVLMVKPCVDETVPFAGSLEEEDGAEQEGDGPPETERVEIRFADGSDGGMNSKAAGEQTNGGEDGEIEDFARRGAGKALANVKEVGDDEDGEDGGLCGDETSHANMTLVGERPLGVERGGGDDGGGHTWVTSCDEGVPHVRRSRDF